MTQQHFITVDQHTHFYGFFRQSVILRNVAVGRIIDQHQIIRKRNGFIHFGQRIQNSLELLNMSDMVRNLEIIVIIAFEDDLNRKTTGQIPINVVEVGNDRGIRTKIFHRIGFYLDEKNTAGANDQNNAGNDDGHPLVFQIDVGDPAEKTRQERR